VQCSASPCCSSELQPASGCNWQSPTTRWSQWSCHKSVMEPSSRWLACYSFIWLAFTGNDACLYTVFQKTGRAFCVASVLSKFNQFSKFLYCCKEYLKFATKYCDISHQILIFWFCIVFCNCCLGLCVRLFRDYFWVCGIFLVFLWVLLSTAVRMIVVWDLL